MNVADLLGGEFAAAVASALGIGGAGGYGLSEANWRKFRLPALAVKLEELTEEVKQVKGELTRITAIVDEEAL